MRARWTSAIFAAVTTLLAGQAACAPKDSDDKAIWFGKADHAMNASVDEARATLPIFWKHLEQDREVRHFLIKVAFPTSHGGVEHLWIGLTSTDEKALHGEILNEPEDVPNVHAGQPYEITEPSKISDWSYEKAGKFYGQFTTRAMLKAMDEKGRAEQLEVLAPTPLEPGDR